jgi:membrane protease YdiL (CAAX protease family)
MTIVEQDTPALPSSLDQPSPQPESPWRLIAVAVGWVLLAEATAGVIGFFSGFFRTTMRVPASVTSELLLLTLSLLGAGIVLLAASIIRGRIIGDGDVRKGLSDYSIGRLPIIVLLAVAIVGYASLAEYGFYVGRPDLFSKFSSVNIYLQLFNFFIVACLSPVAEELFFRGWLWNGLRRYWSALPTASVTALLWLAIHLEQGLYVPLALIPAAFILTIARQVSKSVRAPIALHVIYNLVIAAVPISLVLTGHMPAPAKAAPPIIPLSRNVFSGNEARIADMNYVNADCSPGPVPDTRVFTAPKNGSVRLEKTTIPVDRKAGDPRANCNGKPVQAMSVFYRSRGAFTGTDSVVLDVDFLDGTVNRYDIKINVR